MQKSTNKIRGRVVFQGHSCWWNNEAQCRVVDCQGQIFSEPYQVRLRNSPFLARPFWCDERLIFALDYHAVIEGTIPCDGPWQHISCSGAACHQARGGKRIISSIACVYMALICCVLLSSSRLRLL